MFLLIDYKSPRENNRLAPGSTSEGGSSDSGGEDSHYTKPDMWRTWSLQRPGFNNTEFEGKLFNFGLNPKISCHLLLIFLTKTAAEIPSDTYNSENGLISKDEIIAKAADATKILDGWKANNHNRIRVRIQHLETELASALHTLRSRSKGSNNKEVFRCMTVKTAIQIYATVLC